MLNRLQRLSIPPARRLIFWGQRHSWTGVGFPECVDWAPKMIDRLLKSSTGVLLIVNWCNGQLSPCENLASPPRTVHAQQSIRDIDRDLDYKAPQRFVLHAICLPARSGRRRISDPLSKLSGLRSRKLSARPFECSFKSALRATLYPAIQSWRSHVGNFGSSLDGKTIVRGLIFFVDETKLLLAFGANLRMVAEHR
jgi:hypothetical protein